MSKRFVLKPRLLAPVLSPVHPLVTPLRPRAPACGWWRQCTYMHRPVAFLLLGHERLKWLLAAGTAHPGTRASAIWRGGARANGSGRVQWMYLRVIRPWGPGWMGAGAGNNFFRVRAVLAATGGRRRHGAGAGGARQKCQGGGLGWIEVSCDAWDACEPHPVAPSTFSKIFQKSRPSDVTGRPGVGCF